MYQNYMVSFASMAQWLYIGFPAVKAVRLLSNRKSIVTGFTGSETNTSEMAQCCNINEVIYLCGYF